MWYNKASDAFGDKVAEQQKIQSNQSEALVNNLEKFKASWNYAEQTYHKRWEDNHKLYNNIRTKKTHPGVIETFVPMVNSSVNTIVAALFNTIPSVKYLPNYANQESATDAVSKMYMDFGRKDGWVQKNKVNGRQWVITGNMFSFYEWQPDKSGGYVHKISVPGRDMIIDPNSTGPDSWRYVGRRYFASKKSLEKETIYDLKSDKNVSRWGD